MRGRPIGVLISPPQKEIKVKIPGLPDSDSESDSEEGGVPSAVGGVGSRVAKRSRSRSQKVHNLMTSECPWGFFIDGRRKRAIKSWAAT